MEEKNLKQVDVEVKEEERVIPESQPKLITMEVGINGVPKLDIKCDTEVSVRDIATVLATVDTLNFNNYLRRSRDNENEALRQFVMFETLRKQIFLEAVAKLGVDKKTLEVLGEI